MKSETPQPAAAQSLLQQAAKEWLERYPYSATTGAGESYIAFSRAWPIIAGIASQSEVQPPAAATQELLRELYALVKGECPSLLNEDSGGDASLDLRIAACLKVTR